MNQDNSSVADRQRDFFNTGVSKSIPFRVKQLKALKQVVQSNESRIIEALYKDLRKPATEAYMTDIGPVLCEIDHAIKHIKSWSKPKKVRTPLVLFPGSSRIHREPYGSVLIIGTWNYPFLLTVSPLVNAMAAGNCVVVKPSEIAPHTSALIASLLKQSFQPEYITAIEGGAQETQALLDQRFDYLFFTGSSSVGKIVMTEAAKHLTPVTLELGGKNPCIVDKNSDLIKSGRRIAWGKYMNAGQTCVAPDYLLVHASVKKTLLDCISASITAFFGANPFESSDYGRIVSDHHYKRLISMLREGKVILGGQTDPDSRYLAPTIIDGISWNHDLMQDEIFGPILPVLEYEDLDSVIELLKTRHKPLALYFFSNDSTRQDKIVRSLSAGGISINDTFAHLINLRLPFGGVGQSGMGAYHLKAGFDTFSHNKSVLKRSVRADPRFKYPPYKTPLKYLKWTMRFFL